ncbi:MAG: phosphotransferase [Chloroflexota bacterium]
MTDQSSWITSRPEINTGDAAAALQRWWDLHGALEDLPSERDRNFVVRGEGGAPTHVFKIANLAEDPAFLECQHQAMRHLSGAGVPVQQVIPAVDGRKLVQLGDHGAPWARLLMWLPGRTLASIVEPSPDLWPQLGATMGRSATALLTFDHPAAHRTFQWDVQRAGAVIAAGIPDVDDTARHDLLDRVLYRLRLDLIPRLRSLRRSPIHNDANDHNVLVDVAGTRVLGLLDFGDMVHSITAQEAAVACAYASFGRTEPMAVIGAVLTGFVATCPLTTDELDAMPSLIMARVAMSVAISANQARLSPDPYLRISEEPAWALLERLDAESPSQLRASVLGAVSL